MAPPDTSPHDDDDARSEGNAPGGSSSQSTASEAPASDERSRRRWGMYRRWGLGLGALVLLGLAVLLLFGGAEENEAPADASQGPDTLRAEGYVTRPTALTDHIFTTGTLRANEGVELTSEASGKVTRILFQEGDRVERDQLLVALNSEDLKAEREQLRHELKLSRRRAAREEALLEKGGISEQDYEETANQVKVLQARIERVEAEIEKRRIRAPFGGTIGLRYVSPGSYLSPGQRIASLRDLSPIKVDLSVPARYASRLHVGDLIRFNIEGTDRTFRAEIYAVEPSVAEDTRAVQIRARVPNRDRVLRPGAFADVEVVFEEFTDALVVPAIAVMPERNRRRVYVAHRGTAEPRIVRTGIRTDSTVQITSGLQMQDTVLVSGLQSVRGGTPVLIDTLVGGRARSGVGGLKRAVERTTSLPAGGG